MPYVRSGGSFHAPYLWANQPAEQVLFLGEIPGTDNQRFVYTARLDGSDAATPRQLRANAAAVTWFLDILSDGRVIAALDSMLWAIDLNSNTATRLIPTGQSASVEAILDNGSTLAVELYLSPAMPRTLALVSTDGAHADAPIVITEGLEQVRAAVALRDGIGLVFLAREVGGAWTLGSARLISDSIQRQSLPLTEGGYLAALAPDNTWVLGCDDTGRVLRFPIPGDNQSVRVIATPPLYQPGCPPNLSLNTDGTLALFAAHANNSWQLWSAPSNGSAPPTPIATEYSHKAIVGGVVALAHPEQIAASAVYRMDERDTAQRLSVEHTLSIESARMCGRGKQACYQVGGGWFAASSAGADAQQARALSPENAAWAWLGEEDGHALFWAATETDPWQLAGGKLWSVSLDTPEPNAMLLVSTDTGGTPPLLPVGDGRVLVGLADGLVAYPVDGGASTTLIANGGGDSRSIPMLIDVPRQRIVALRYMVGQQLVAARLDGSEANSALVLLSSPSDIIASVFPSSRPQDLLITLATSDTAVPHPYRSIVVAADGSEADAPRSLATGSYLLRGEKPPESVWESVPSDAPIFSSDGSMVLASGPEGLSLVLVEGGGEPTMLSPRVNNWQTFKVASDRKTLAAVQDDQTLVAIPLERGGQPRALTPALPSTILDMFWSSDNQWVFFTLGGQAAGEGNTLYVASADGADAGALRRLGASMHSIEQLIMPIGPERVLVRARNGGDRSLYVVAPDDTWNTLTPLDDAAESWLGFVTVN